MTRETTGLTVGELIEILQEFPKDAPVRTPVCGRCREMGEDYHEDVGYADLEVEPWGERRRNPETGRMKTYAEHREVVVVG